MVHDSGHVDTFAARHLPPPEHWPKLTFELPELDYPDRLNCADVLLQAAHDDNTADRVAVIDDVRQLTYRELDAMAARFANELVGRRGLVSGNRVLLRSANNAALAAAWLGVMKAGGIAVTTMPMLRAKELQVIVDKARVSHVLCDRRLADVLESLNGVDGGALDCCVFDAEADDVGLTSTTTAFDSVSTAADDTALLAFTSGTTGTPKATMHFHRDVLAMADIVGGRLLGTSPDDVYIGSPPLGFTFGLGVSLVFPLRFGASVVLLEAPTPEALLDGIGRHRVTGLFTAPAMYRALLKHFDDGDARDALSSVRLCVSAGEALPAPTSDAWFDATGLRIVDGIGATEMIHIFISATGADIRPGATGKPLPGYVACVLDDDGRPQRAGNRDGSPCADRPVAATSTTRARASTSSTAGTSPATSTRSTPTATSGFAPAPTT